MKPSGTDWSDPKDNFIFAEATLVKGEGGPGVLTRNMFVVKARPTSKRVAGLSYSALIYYCRKAALTFPQFRKELLEMVEALPPEASKDSDNNDGA